MRSFEENAISEITENKKPRVKKSLGGTRKMKTLDLIDKCMCRQCKNLKNWYSIYSIDSKGKKNANGVFNDKSKAIEALKKLHDNGHFHVRLIEGKLSCVHRVSNGELDYVIEQIINKSYLFKPPCRTHDGRRYLASSSLYEAKKQTCISFSAHSQSPVRTLVPCQRCDHGSHYVYLDRVYVRMVKRELIDKYPEVDDNGYMNI